MPLALMLKRRRLRRTLRWALKAPYYRSSFAKANIAIDRVRSPEDLGEFFITGDLLKREPEVLLCARPELAIESSGTSGRISRVYLSRAELEYLSGQGSVASRLFNLDGNDRLLCTLDMAFGLGALLVDGWVRRLPLFAMVVGRVDPMEAYRRMGEYGFNILVSDPFWLRGLTEIAREYGRPSHLKLMIGGGEGVTRQNRAELEGFWEAPLYMTYSLTEAAAVLGFECTAQNGYHVNGFDFYVEVDNPDPDGYGEIVFTTLSRRVMPLIRYRTGDVARWIHGNCNCGFPFRRLSPLRGRLDEQVSCAWGNLHPDFFAAVLSSVPGITDDWQVAVQERKGKQIIQFRLEPVNGGQNQEELRGAIMNALEAQQPSVRESCRQGLIGVEFSMYATGELRRTRKLLRLVDERAYEA